MGKHSYSWELEWTGNKGKITSDNSNSVLDYLLHFTQKISIEGSSDPILIGNST
jgi:hypothetical protein